MPRQSTIPAQQVTEDIRSVEEITGLFVRVMVGTIDSQTGDFTVPQQFVTYEIKGDDFAELMSANPEWAPSKPAGTYRNDDLWVFIDRIRGA